MERSFLTKPNCGWRRSNFVWEERQINFNMPTRKKKVYARFNVGTMMKQLKELREKTALEHENVLTATRDLQAKQAKVRRLQQKVMNVYVFLVIRKPIRFTTNRISLNPLLN